MNYCQSSPISDSLSMIFKSPLGAQTYCARRDDQYSGNKRTVTCSVEAVTFANSQEHVGSNQIANAPSSTYQSTSAFWNNSSQTK